MYYHSKTPEEYITQRIITPKNKDYDCWIWVGPKDKDGYGQCQHGTVAKKLGVTRAHQLSWVMANGNIPDNLFVCHSCDNPSCVNPNHLFLGTHTDNMRDMVKKGRAISGMKVNANEGKIVALHTIKSSKDVAALFNLSYSRVCQIWRSHNKYGRHF